MEVAALSAIPPGPNVTQFHGLALAHAGNEKDMLLMELAE